MSTEADPTRAPSPPRVPPRPFAPPPPVRSPGHPATTAWEDTAPPAPLPPAEPPVPAAFPTEPPEPRRPPRTRARTAAAALCLVLGVGLLGGAAAGGWLSEGSEEPTAEAVFAQTRELWRETPVDELFPRTLHGEEAGPGGADRRWIRAAVAPDSTCDHAFDELLAKALSPVGCRRLVRASYVDETTSSVTTVGLLFTKADAEGMRQLRERFAGENLTQRTDLMPRPYAARGTDAADFGDAQRATWTVRVRTDVPVVVYAVTGFADGRAVSDPQPAAEATEKGAATAPAQAGLGHDAQGIADRIERGVRKASAGGAKGGR